MVGKKGNSGSKYARFSTIGIQMGITIGGFTYLGVYLDEKFHNKTAWWTVGLSLFGVGAGLYLLIKEVINTTSQEEDATKEKKDVS